MRLDALWIALAGIGGVLLGGWLDRRRERWRWRMDARRHSYGLLLQRLDTFSPATDKYVEALRSRRSEVEVEVLGAEFERQTISLLGAITEIKIFGSPRMQELAREIEDSTWEMRFLTGDESKFVEMWDSVDEGTKDHVGVAYAFTEYPDEVLHAVRPEMALRGFRERWVDWRASQRAKRQRKKVLAELDAEDQSS